MCARHGTLLRAGLVVAAVAAMTLIAAGVPLHGGLPAVAAVVACFTAAAGLAVVAWTRVPAQVREGADVFVARIVGPAGGTLAAIVLVAYVVNPALWT